MEQSSARPLRRKRVPVYVTEDELACLTRGARAAGKARGPFMRGASLYRAGWREYCGPLWQPGADVAEIERYQAGEVLHQTLRSIRELATTCSAIYNRAGAKPKENSIRLLVALCMTLGKFQEDLAELRRFPDALDLVLDLEALAGRIDGHHPIAAGQLKEGVALVRDALERKDVDGGKAKQSGEAG